MRLRSTHASMRADLILEGGDFLEIGVVAAVDHQVGSGGVAVDLGDLQPCVRAEHLQRVLATDHAR